MKDLFIVSHSAGENNRSRVEFFDNLDEAEHYALKIIEDIEKSSPDGTFGMYLPTKIFSLKNQSGTERFEHIKNNNKFIISHSVEIQSLIRTKEV